MRILIKYCLCGFKSVVFGYVCVFRIEKNWGFPEINMLFVFLSYFDKSQQFFSLFLLILFGWC